MCPLKKARSTNGCHSLYSFVSSSLVTSLLYSVFIAEAMRLALLAIVLAVAFAGYAGYNGPGAACQANADCSIGLACSRGSCSESGTRGYR